MANISQLTPIEQLAFSTIRIETDLKDGGIGTGTGFFYKVKDDGANHIPVVVTNRHVIEDSTKGRFRLTLEDADGLPVIKEHRVFEMDNFQNEWKCHPDASIDLCVMPIAPLLRIAEKQGEKFFFTTLDKSLLPTDEDYNAIFGMDDIIMIGYPNGIWDKANNFPVFRKGITATNPKYDWNNKKQFLIDCACFPGSSGSPVILAPDSHWIGYYSKNVPIRSAQVRLLGIIYAGPQYTVTGEIEIVDVPVAQRPRPVSQIPINLGIVIKSELLKDFDSLFG